MVSKRPTLKTISELSGFAVPTVSRALKDAPDIGASTKAKVRQIAAEVGYIPNRAGVRLRTGKTHVISVVLSTEHDSSDDHTGRLISSVANSLRGTPYHMIVTPFTDDEDRLSPIRYLVETGSADAVIMNEIEHDDARVNYLMEKGFPFVTYGRDRRCRDHPYFDFDNGTFGHLAAQSMLQRDRRSILLIAPPRDQSYSRHMIEGAGQGLSQPGVHFEILDGVTSHEPNARMRAAIAGRLESDPRIDGIIAPSSTSAISAVAALEHLGLVLGRDIDVFAKEATPFLCFFRREIAIVREDVFGAGEFLARAAIRAVERPDLPPMQALAVAQAPRPTDNLF